MRAGVLCSLLAALCPAAAFTDTSSWFGAEYTPAGASNALWWAFYGRYVPAVEREMGFMSRRLAFNSLRMFLNPLVFEANATGLLMNLDHFLGTADKHGLKVHGGLWAVWRSTPEGTRAAVGSPCVRTCVACTCVFVPEWRLWRPVTD